MVLLTGCRQEPVEERAYRLLTATLKDGGEEIRQRNRVYGMRFAHAIKAQGNHSEDVAYASEAEALRQSTDSILRYLDATRRGLQSIIGSDSQVRTYLTGNGSAADTGKLPLLYQLLVNHRKPLAGVVGRYYTPASVFPNGFPAGNPPRDTLRGFLQPFRDVTGSGAEALLTAYETHVVLLQHAASETALGRVGAYPIRDYFSAPLLAVPRQDSVKAGSVYEADIYLSFGLQNWTLYQAVINGEPVEGKPAASYHRKATLTAARGKDGKPQQWEAQLHLFNDHDEDTVITIRRPFPLYTYPPAAVRNAQ
ncbi:MAG: hypothetical protein ICV83_06320 [Cytophagales bacterium]|nr:hypothetical protein [Cytophagales bacterium]